jgi:uncharacterized protein YjiS (DUF1127 family)
MSNKLTFLRRIINAFERSAETRARDYLLSLSDRHLDDMGLSRELIKQGPDAWPWHKAEDSLSAPGLSAAMPEVNTVGDAQAANLASGRRDQPAFDKTGTETKLAA